MVEFGFLVGAAGVTVALVSLWWNRIRTLPEVVVDDVEVEIRDISQQPNSGGGQGPSWLVQMTLRLIFKNTGSLSGEIEEFRVDHLDVGRGVENVHEDPILNPIGPGSTFDYQYSFGFVVLGVNSKSDIRERFERLSQKHFGDRPQMILTRVTYRPDRSLLGRRRTSQYGFIYRGGERVSSMTTDDVDQLDIELPEDYNLRR